jgi:hypothetical protein
MRTIAAVVKFGCGSRTSRWSFSVDPSESLVAEFPTDDLALVVSWGRRLRERRLTELAYLARGTAVEKAVSDELARR